jgi:uncharacterized membrane protein YbhN (UPF0104 family)
MNGTTRARRAVALLQPRMLLPLAFVLLAAALIFRQGVSLNWHSVWVHLRGANPSLLLLALLVFYLALPVRTARWRILLRHATAAGEEGPIPPPRELMAIVFQSWFVNAVTVARLGDIYRATLLHAASGAARATTLGTIVAERLIDVAALAATLGVSALLAFQGHLPRDLGTGSAAGLTLAGGGALAIALAGRSRALIEHLVPLRFHDAIAQLTRGFARSFANTPAVVALSFTGWLLEGASLFLVATAIGAPIPLAGAIAVASIASLLTAVPLAPGGFGMTEVGMVVVLTRLGAGAELAGAVTLLYRLVSYWSLVALGGVFLITRKTFAKPRPLAHAFS